MSWVCKFHNFFWHAQKLRQDLYLSALSTVLYGKWFPTFWYLFSFFHMVCKLFKDIFHPLCWSVNWMSWVSKFHNFFWHAQKLRQHLYFSTLSIVLYGKWFPTFWYLFSFFQMVGKLFRGIFHPLCWSVNCMSWIFELWIM